VTVDIIVIGEKYYLPDNLMVDRRFGAYANGGSKWILTLLAPMVGGDG